MSTKYFQPEMIFVDDGTLVPVEQQGWASCCNYLEGQDPFRSYINGREVAERLPQAAPEGAVCEINWAGGSGWYRSTYRRESGVWVEVATDAPWQLRA